MPATKKTKKLNKVKLKMRISWKNVIIYAFLILFTAFLFFGISQPSGTSFEDVKTVPLSQLISDVNKGKVSSIEVFPNKIQADENGTTVRSFKELDASVYQLFKDANVSLAKTKVVIKDDTTLNTWINIIGGILPVILMVAFFYFIFRQARGAQENIFSFGKSSAKLFSKDTPKVTFSDVAGVDEAKQELTEIVDFLKNPGKYKAMGARTPKGVLMIGPSGTGKTLLARATAGEADVAFFSMAGSEFMEMLVGVGSARVRDLFEMAKASQPSLIFIDEIDAIGRQRGMGIGGGHDEREQTLNQILVEMDGFDPRLSVIVVAASVTGDTPILVREEGVVKLLPISDIVDKYYEPFEEGVEVNTPHLETLSYQNQGGVISPKYVGVKSVFRHKVNEIYEISYIGGKIRTTGNHSVFVWESGKVTPKMVSDMKPGDVLVDLTPKQLEEIKSDESDFEVYIKVYSSDSEMEENYQMVVGLKGMLSQEVLAKEVGVAQTTVSLWHRGVNGPRALSRDYYKHDLPEDVRVTPEFMRLLGYYTAEGYARKEIDFCFNEKETEYIKDVKNLMFRTFGLTPQVERSKTHGAINIIYQSTPVANVFKAYCGSGARSKHIPPFLFEAPYGYFKEFLTGLARGDGHIDNRGRLEITSMSKRLITELIWLSRIHGLKPYFTSFQTKEGRTIAGGKPIHSSRAFRIGFGKYYNIFNDLKGKVKEFKRPIVKSIKKMAFNGFVYDLCGCDNEAFFIGVNPILGHNTNRPDMLDPALVRPGRFDRRVTISLPDLRERQEIIKIHMRGKPFVESVNTEKIARRTVGFSGADIENMINEAAIFAARGQKKSVDDKDLEEAALKVQLGPEKKKMQSEEERRVVAYHEAGHAIVAVFTKGMDPVHRISIISRGPSLGHTLFPPVTERYNETKTRLLSMITTSLGGRAAEELVLNEQTVGASNDIEKATEIARRMVTEFGMSDLGPISYDGNDGKFWLARQMGEGQGYSQDVAAKIDAEVKKIIDESFKKAQKILEDNRGKLDLIAQELMKKETLESEEFERLIGLTENE